jgi:hypothetical protein
MFDLWDLPQSNEVRAFCAASEVYYEAMMFGSILCLNVMMEDGIGEKTKAAEALYVENRILAEHLFGLIEKVEKEMVPKMDKHQFVGRDGLQHTLNLMNVHFIAKMEKARTVYGFVKDTIDHKYASWNLDTIKSGLVVGGDLVGAFIEKEAGIQAPEF